MNDNNLTFYHRDDWQEEDMQLLAAAYPYAMRIKKYSPHLYDIQLNPDVKDASMLRNTRIQVIHSVDNCSSLWKNCNDAELPLIVSIDGSKSNIMRPESATDLIMFRYPDTYPFAFIIERDKLYKVMQEYGTILKLRYKKKSIFYCGSTIEYYSVPISKVMTALKSIYVVNPVKLLNVKWGSIEEGDSI